MMTETVLLEKQTLNNFEDVSGKGVYRPTPTYMEWGGFVVGERYKIVWDDVAYYCTCKPDEDGDPYIGNYMLPFNIIEPGEPFCILNFNGCIFFYVTFTGSSHTLEISIVEQPIVLKDRNGSDIPYDTTSVLKVPTADGKTRMFIEGEAEATTVSLDFSDGDMEVIPEGKKLFNRVSIPTPEGLIPENIPKGRTIAGIKGELSVGGEIDLNDKPIRFYDPYGNVIYGYSRAEIQELTALPAGPALKGVTFEKWTHTLDELKAVTYYADVGPMYKYGSNPATILIVETIVASEVIKLTLTMTTSSYKATVYWGDGSSSTLSGTTASSGTNQTHTYTSAGVYIIAIVANNNFKLGSTGSNYIYPPIGAGSVPTYTTGYSYFVGNCSANLKSILTASNGPMSGYYYADVKNAALCTGLKFISVPSKRTMDYMSKQFLQCTALTTINGKFLFGTGYQFCFVTNLKRVAINGSVAANTFIGCDSLIEVMFGSGAITDANMNSKWAMLMTTETPPSISATSPQWGTKPIYVPDSAVEAYKTASGWSNAAAYILPASQYPDK